MPDVPLTNAQLHLSRKKSSDSKPPSCRERPLTLFHPVQSTEKRESLPGVPWGHLGRIPTAQRTHLCLCVWAAAFCVLEDSVLTIMPSQVLWLSNLNRTGSRGAEDERQGAALSRIHFPDLLWADSWASFPPVTQSKLSSGTASSAPLWLLAPLEPVFLPFLRL